jgi:hypothetical protein
MSQEVSVNLKCILLRSGVEIWAEESRVENLKKILVTSKESKFVELDDNVINTADISGIFTSKEMEDVIRRKNGQWKDDKGNWHDKGDRVCSRCKQIIPYGMKCGKCRY